MDGNLVLSTAWSDGKCRYNSTNYLTVGHCGNGSVTVQYQAGKLVHVTQTVGTLFDGQSYTLITGYEYYPNGSYSIHFQSGLTLQVPLGNVSEYSLNLWVLPSNETVP